MGIRLLQQPGDADIQQCGSFFSLDRSGTAYIPSGAAECDTTDTAIQQGGSHSVSRQSNKVCLCTPERWSAAELVPTRLQSGGCTGVLCRQFRSTSRPLFISLCDDESFTTFLQVGEGTCYAAWPVGSTPLHIAAAKGALQIIRAMLQAQVRLPSCVHPMWNALQHWLPSAQVRALSGVLQKGLHFSPFSPRREWIATQESCTVLLA